MENMENIKKNNVLSVWSPKPGEGVSFISYNLAHIIGNEFPEESVCIIDANLFYPFMRVLLGKPEAEVLSELWPMVDVGELDEEVIKSMAIKITKNISFIGGVVNEESPEEATINEFATIINTCRKAYDRVIIDAGSRLDYAGSIAALQESDIVLVLSSPNILSQAYLKTFLKYLPPLGIETSKFYGVVNKYSEAALPKAEILYEGTDVKFSCVIPDLGDAADKIINEGKKISPQGREQSDLYYTLLDTCERHGFIPVKEEGNRPKPTLFRKVVNK